MQIHIIVLPKCLLYCRAFQIFHQLYNSTIMALKHHDDWQSSKKTVLQRNAYMFNNELMSDVSFTCGESRRIFHAHKYVLATSSAVFYAMFYGDLAQKESPIHMTDTREESFKEFLRFLYTDECKITAENATGVLYLAKKYLMSCLAEKCCKVLEANLAPGNVLVALEQAIRLDEKRLEAKCWNIVLNNALECINSEVFCNIGSHTLNTLLKKQTLKISEVDLFKAVLRWTDSECARQDINIEDDKMARRRVLGDSLYEIRFLEMSEQDFATSVSPTGILTDTEVVTMFQKFNGLDVTGFKWEEQGERGHSRLIGFSRFEVNDIRGSWGYDGTKCDALAITVNKAVVFHGVRLFGQADDSKYEVKFSIKDEGVTKTYTSEQDKDEVWGYDVMLPTPVFLSSNEEFTIMATINGPSSQRGGNGKSSVTLNDIVVTFKNPPSCLRSNGTGKRGGQFYKIFLSSM